jgi:hypothetical protein
MGDSLLATLRAPRARVPGGAALWLACLRPDIRYSLTATGKQGDGQVRLATLHAWAPSGPSLARPCWVVAIAAERVNRQVAADSQ